MKTLNNYISERLNPRNLGSGTLPRELKEKYKLIYNPGTDRYDCNSYIMVESDLIDGTGHFICNFGVVKRYFNCSACENLTSLEGAPKEVGESFNCSDCKNLASLEGVPKEIRGSFYCDDCKKLASLEGAPKIVKGDFICNYCDNLTSLEGAPKEVGGDFYCYKCKNLRSLKGAPEEVGGDFDCSDCSELTDYNINTKIGGDFIK